MKIVKNRKLEFDEIEISLLYDHGYEEEHVAQIMPKLEEIRRLRDEKNAVILAHYYQIPPIQLIADIRGDSLKLAQSAKEIKDKRLVVCSTVRFMAEMVKLLSPEKKVVVPALDASCSIAEGINGESVRKIRERFSNAGIVAYVNTYADTKAEVDAICTSANAMEVLRNIKGNPVILLPDYFFAKNILSEVLKRNNGREYLAYKKRENGSLVLEDVASGKEIRILGNGFRLPILDKGTCVVHEQFTPDEIQFLRRKDKIEVVMSHPEVSQEVATVSDFVGGTGKMLDYVSKSKARRYLVITECDLTAPLRENFPDREFFTPCKLCPYMKKNNIDGLIYSLKNEVYEITVDQKVADGARMSLEKMFELTGGGK